MTIRPCAIIPSRNHYEAVSEIVERLRREGLPVFVVDDGSDEPARGSLAALHAPERGVVVHRLATNLGKGGAVVAGFALAAAAGHTHALQIDADGQHDLAALPLMLASGRLHPGSLILGQPVYDGTAPFGRRVGRWLTHFWVCVETLSVRIIDSMCGFRLYPLEPVTEVLRQEHIGRRMDFDTEILVHLVWRGVQPVTVPIRVTYPAGNASNFRMLRDNWAITKMHGRLFLAMLSRLSRIPSARRRVPASPSHWANLEERGAYWGVKLLATTYRLLGWGGCMTLLFPVAIYFHATNHERRRASRDFLRRAFAAQGRDRPPTAIDSLRHSLRFARRAAETAAAWMGGIGRDEVELVDKEELAHAESLKRGIILIVSHHGNIDLGRATLDPGRLSRITALVHTRHARNYARLIERIRPEAAVNTIQVAEMDPGTIIALDEAIERNHWIAVAGDRTPVNGGKRASRVRFLGEDAAFPQGPYLLAHLLGCPVYLMFCLREKGRYRLYFERFADRIRLPRRDREATLAALAARYAQRLEVYCMKDPFQWYNFFDFWAAPGRAKAAKP